MVTVAIGKYSQAQGTLVRLEGTKAYINTGSRLVCGELLTPRDQLPAVALEG